MPKPRSSRGTSRRTKAKAKPKAKPKMTLARAKKMASQGKLSNADLAALQKRLGRKKR